MEKGKRILSLLLAFVLVLSLLPMSAFAAVVGGDSIDKELEAQNPLTYYISRLADVPGKAPVVKNNNGKNIINRTSNYGSTTSGNSLTGITGAAYCADHTKGIKGPYYPVKISAKNQVPSQWPNWIRGIMASGYPTKNVKQQVGAGSFGWVANCETVARESGCTVVGITEAQWNQLVELVNNGTFDEFCWEAATQLAVWHATQGIEIKGGMKPNTGKSQWSKSGETVSVANNTDTKSTAIIIAARYILVNGWQWAKKVNSSAVNAGGFFGADSEVGGNGVLNHVVTDSGTSGSILGYSGIPESGNWAPRGGEQDRLAIERLLDLNEDGIGYTVKSRGNPKMLLDAFYKKGCQPED